MVLAFTLSLCIAGALIGLGLPAWFKAEGIVVIHSRPHRMADLQELPDPSPDLNVIQSEVDILKSRSVIETKQDSDGRPVQADFLFTNLDHPPETRQACGARSAN
jgi:uncharacterized protein involved in exopolysaccharide biosynthesis